MRKTDKHAVNVEIRGIIFDRWKTNYQVQAELMMRGIFVSESSVGRRIRELRENWPLEKRPASAGNPCCEYRIKRLRKK